MYTPSSSVIARDKKPTVDSNGRPLRVYQVWKGRNKFLLGGRVIFGPDVKSIYLTLSLILVPVISFWIFVSKGILLSFPHGWGIFILFISSVLVLLVIVLLFLTSGTDPGIIPRNTLPPEIDDGDSSILSCDWNSSLASQAGLPQTKNVNVNGMVVKVKFCQTCKLYRPPRCSHCSICNNCVERFDHHCPWVGQCIGKRNYRHFFMFVSSTFLLCLYVLVCCSINLLRIRHEKHCGFWKAVHESPVSGGLVVYTFIICWFVGGLTTFHVYLISTNQTTYENFRYQYDRKTNPYNLGCCRNCGEVFCSGIPKSRNDFRALVETEAEPSFEFRVPAKMPAWRFDMEMGKRRSVDADEFEDIRSHISSLGRLERCSTEPRREPNWEHKIEWGISPDHAI